MEVPQALATRDNWVLWKYVGAERRKVPFQTNGQPAKSNDPSTWTSLANAKAALAGFAGGLGFVFAADDDVFGIDLDGCIDDGGVIQTWAAEILAEFPTYAEYSPSGTGVKIYGLGTLPGTGKKRVLDDAPVVCDRKPGIEAYCRGRFFCFTGQPVPLHSGDLNRCQAALDVAHVRFWPAPAPRATNVPPVPPMPQGDVPERARRYLAKLPPAVSGDGGDTRLFQAACILVLKFNLPPDTAYPILAEWNTTCVPPWNENRLRYKISQADKQPCPRGELLNSNGDAPVDISAILESFGPDPDAPPPEPAPAREPFPQECIDGMPYLMRLAYDYAIDTAIKPQPQLTLAALIALFGAVFGRRVMDDYGTRTNIMVLGLSPSGSGKEHPRQVNKEILFRSGLDKINGPERIGSHAGIISSLVQHQVRLFQIDEIGRLLATMRDAKAAPHLYSIGTVLMALYSSANSMWTGDAYADLTKVKRINQPCACLFGTSVPEGFYSNLTQTNLSDGLLARMIVLDSEGYGTRRKPNLQPVPGDLVATLDAWNKGEIGRDKDSSENLDWENPKPMLVKKTDEANARHERYCNEVHQRHANDDACGASLWSRAPEKEAKLALIYACCESRYVKPVIDIKAIDWGRRIANYTTRLVLNSVQESVALSNYDSEKKKAWKFIRDGMTSNEFSRKTQWIRARERAEILLDWENCGAIERVEEPTKTKKKIIIRKLRSSPN